MPRGTSEQRTENVICIVICPNCREAYQDNGTRGPVAEAFAANHGKINCKSEPLNDCDAAESRRWYEALATFPLSVMQ